jgi:hypothetical protein
MTPGCRPAAPALQVPKTQRHSAWRIPSEANRQSRHARIPLEKGRPRLAGHPQIRGASPNGSSAKLKAGELSKAPVALEVLCVSRYYVQTRVW